MMQQDITLMLSSGQEDILWFDSQLAIMKETYDNSFVAFRRKQIIETDADLGSLMEKLRKKKVDANDTFIRFVSTVKHIL